MAPYLEVMQVRNIRTGARFKKCHHCTECRSRPGKKCFDGLHIAFCTAELPSGELCGERFAVRSPAGCARHKFSGGHNAEIKNRRRGLSTVFDDTDTDAGAGAAEPNDGAPAADDIALAKIQGDTTDDEDLPQAKRSRAARNPRRVKEKVRWPLQRGHTIHRSDERPKDNPPQAKGRRVRQKKEGESQDLLSPSLVAGRAAPHRRVCGYSLRIPATELLLRSREFFSVKSDRQRSFRPLGLQDRSWTARTCSFAGRTVT